jgi:RNA polymerase sigma factor (sigma-70 family)
LGDAGHELTPAQATLVRSSTVVERAVRTVAARTRLSLDELRGVAHLALCEAARRFDPKRGVPFDGFSWVVVLRELGKAQRVESRHQRGRVAREAREASYGDFDDVPDPGDLWADTDASTRGYLQEMSDQVAARMALGIATAMMAAGDEDDLAERQHHAVLVATLRDVLTGLPDHARRLLELRYFANMEFEPLARELGVGLATVRRHHLSALALVGKRIRSRGVEGLR